MKNSSKHFDEDLGKDIALVMDVDIQSEVFRKEMRSIQRTEK